MKERLKKKWMHLYELAQIIGGYRPWDDFYEKDRFVYMGDKENALYFSFISDSAQRLGIACYVGEENYLKARKLLTSKNEKHEPVFMLQDALICLWGNREDLDKESYEIIKELGFKFRGKGCWLHFESYQKGYLPNVPEEEEIDLWINALENLVMMLRAIYHDGVDPHFEEGETFLRWYNSEDKLYYNHSFKIDIPDSNIGHPCVTVKENDLLIKVRNMKSAGFNLELDWSYLNEIFVDSDGRETFPLAIMGVDSENGYILASEMLSPTHNHPNMVFNLFDSVIMKYGKPKEIHIRDEDLKGILADVCQKVGIKLVMKKRLSKINTALKELVAQLG